jgi:MoxR-like ATPase
VLLIDEIDKADPDLPNALLEVLANNGFRVPHALSGAGQVVCSDATRPLVVITTNVVMCLERPRGRSQPQ